MSQTKSKRLISDFRESVLRGTTSWDRVDDAVEAIFSEAQCAPPWTPLRNAQRLGPYAHDGKRELEFEVPLPIGAIPVADHSVEPLRGRNKCCRFAAGEEEPTNDYSKV
jgi:hypothetical protein